MIVLFDQMLPQYADEFDMPNFRALRDSGTDFEKAYLGYMASETVMAHNVITSGLELVGPGPVGRDVQPALPLAAGDPGGGVQQGVAQPFRLCLGELAVQGEVAGPGEQVDREGDDLAPGFVDSQDLDGSLRRPEAFAVRTPSSTRAWTRWRASRRCTLCRARTRNNGSELVFSVPARPLSGTR